MIKITDFSSTPGPRYINEGKWSGEEFRDTILIEKFNEVIKTDSKLTVNLDGTVGYATSFLEESFGGLARLFKPNEVLKRLNFISTEEPYLIDEITEYIQEAQINEL